MPRMRWIRLWTQETLYGTTNRELSLEERAIWFELLALAGDSPTPGTICATPGVSFTNAQLASILGAPEDLVSKTLVKLTTPGINKISVNGSGLIQIVNWQKYQSPFDREEYQREYMKLYMRRYRQGVSDTVKSLPVKSLPVKTMQQKRSEGRGGERTEISNNTPHPPTSAPSFNFDRISKTYENCWGIVSSTYTEDLQALYNDLPQGFTEESWAGMICEAIEAAHKYKKRSIPYLKEVLRNRIKKMSLRQTAGLVQRTEPVEHPPGWVHPEKRPYNPRSRTL